MEKLKEEQEKLQQICKVRNGKREDKKVEVRNREGGM